MSPSVRRALKSSKVNEPLVVRSRRGINFGDEQPSGNKFSTAILYLFFFSALAIAMVTFSCLVNFFIVRISRVLHFCESSCKLLNSNLNYNSHTDRCLVLNRGFSFLF